MRPKPPRAGNPKARDRAWAPALEPRLETLPARPATQSRSAELGLWLRTPDLDAWLDAREAETG